MVIAGCVLAALLIGAFVYLAIRLTVSFLKKFRTRKKSKIMAGTVKDIIKNAPTMSLDDLPDEDDVIIAEYDEEEDELVQDISVCSDVDKSVRGIINNNGGIVVFE